MLVTYMRGSFLGFNTGVASGSSSRKKRHNRSISRNSYKKAFTIKSLSKSFSGEKYRSFSGSRTFGVLDTYFRGYSRSHSRIH